MDALEEQIASMKLHSQTLSSEAHKAMFEEQCDRLLNLLRDINASLKSDAVASESDIEAFKTEIRNLSDKFNSYSNCMCSDMAWIDILWDMMALIEAGNIVKVLKHARRMSET